MKKAIALLALVAFLLGIVTYINVKPSYINDKKVMQQYMLAEEREPRVHGDINNPWGG
ncbi:hypothetical protein SAMN04244560_02481 [Thermoanaerobacter thermohydrosulfuricus]|uniref:Uncharacterized protein n=4 Tax=Thermoanaerobacter TaxID=1754 RepID=I9ADT4_9THEO|nr:MULTISPECIES: hypothetical protein [Thermoanaerobacter]EGD50324.1 hypothetical protein TheetDRAFT_2866 [Thermoanaerobacter ethanolicus JW 200]HHY79823.1 hypothetical protein [Thermoanaerobacter sp.]AEM80011.1 hypothetical protein Thewi_2694 [Thermoanaerobacter wiegelii Rt8.B1]EIW00187.1 hypothetical protein ThesiDRAFT1_1230 [Thermoanaerobacter siderophilus SR4]EMT39703.1 hypothetical protein TthWC1_0792 [Thermoanaerobacter thermohydrosulfuricus WC1]